MQTCKLYVVSFFSFFLSWFYFLHSRWPWKNRHIVCYPWHVWIQCFEVAKLICIQWKRIANSSYYYENLASESKASENALMLGFSHAHTTHSKKDQVNRNETIRYCEIHNWINGIGICCRSLFMVFCCWFLCPTLSSELPLYDGI